MDQSDKNFKQHETRMSVRDAAFPGGAKQETVSDSLDGVAANTADESEAAKRIGEFVSWYGSLPASVVADMGVKKRLEIAQFFGTQFARSRVIVEELKRSDRPHEIARERGCEPRRIKVFSLFMRRYLKRDFYAFQASFSIRNRIGPVAHNDAWVREFLARSKRFRDQYTVKQDLLETLGYFDLEVNVLNPKIGRVLDELLRIDLIMASNDMDPEWLIANPDWPVVKHDLGSVVIEPLKWVKNLKQIDIPTSRFDVLTTTRHIKRREAEPLTEPASGESGWEDPARERIHVVQAHQELALSTAEVREIPVVVKRKRIQWRDHN